jgi:hypothetical protein
VPWRIATSKGASITIYFSIFLFMPHLQFYPVAVVPE